MAIPRTPIDPSRQDPGGDFYKTLVESTKAIAWSIDWASVGVATIVPPAHGERLAFIEMVDRRLYQAKMNGRNRIVDGFAAMETDAAPSRLG